MDVNIQVIARMHSDFATKFGIPRQSAAGGQREDNGMTKTEGGPP